MLNEMRHIIVQDPGIAYGSSDLLAKVVRSGALTLADEQFFP